MAIANLRKAAAFLSSLPKQQAAGLLAALTPEQAAAVSAEMAAAGPIGREEQEAVKRELAASDSFRDTPIEYATHFESSEKVATDPFGTSIFCGESTFRMTSVRSPSTWPTA